MLRDIDKDIKSFGSYIYNVGESSDEIEKLIKKHEKIMDYEDIPTPQQITLSISKVKNKMDWFVAKDEMIE